MRVELHDQTGVVGEVRLSGGLAVPSNELARRLMAETRVLVPGVPDPVEPGEGERYLRALELNVQGSRFWAELRGS